VRHGTSDIGLPLFSRQSANLAFGRTSLLGIVDVNTFLPLVISRNRDITPTIMGSPAEYPATKSDEG